jgi:hypothetical protein
MNALVQTVTKKFNQNVLNFVTNPISCLLVLRLSLFKVMLMPTSVAPLPMLTLTLALPLTTMDQHLSELLMHMMTVMLLLNLPNRIQATWADGSW